MEQNWSKNLSYEGTKLGKKGTTLFGWIVSANTGRPGTYQIRCPAIHGYCDINEQNCDEDVVAKASLPIAGTLKPDNGANTSIVNNGLRTYTKGEFVLVRFDADNYGDPVIVSAHKKFHKGKNKILKVIECLLLAVLFSSIFFYVPMMLNGNCYRKEKMNLDTHLSVNSFYCPKGEFNDIYSLSFNGLKSSVKLLFHFPDPAFKEINLFVF